SHRIAYRDDPSRFVLQISSKMSDPHEPEPDDGYSDRGGSGMLRSVAGFGGGNRLMIFGGDQFSWLAVRQTIRAVPAAFRRTRSFAYLVFVLSTFHVRIV